MMLSMDKVQINIIILNNYISYGCCFDNFIQRIVHAYKLTFGFALSSYMTFIIFITILLLIIIN
jgi:hypothetical protein